MRGGRVAGVADPSEHLAGADLLAPGDGDAARRQVRVQRVPPRGLHDHVVTGEPGGVQPSPREPHRGLHRHPGLPHRVEPLALGHAVHGLDDHPVQDRVDRLPPAVAVPCPAPDQQPAQGPRRVHMEPATVVGADQVVGVALPEQVGAVAGDPVRRGPLDRPLPSEGKLDDHRVIELTHGRWPHARSRLLSSGHLDVRYRAGVLTHPSVEAPTSRMTTPGGWPVPSGVWRMDASSARSWRERPRPSASTKTTRWS